MNSCPSAVVESDVNGPIYPLTRQLAAQRKKRRCLHCGQYFDSPGPGYRFCNWCANYLHHSDEDDPFENQVRIGRSGRVDMTSLSVSEAVQVETTLADGGFSEPEDDDCGWKIMFPV